MKTKKERVFLLKKKVIGMFFCIGVLWIGAFSLILLLCEKKYQGSNVWQHKETESAEQEVILQEEWNLMLVNADHPVPEDYVIPEFTQLRNGHAVDSRIYPALQEMMDAAREEGYEPLICSSYRDWDKQQQLYIKKVRSYVNEGYSWEEAVELAAAWVQKPGCSEHQTGLAVDIVDIYYQLLDENQENRPVQQWLMEHCAEYGFILRYPENKKELTGIEYEPWHYRYVGIEAAKEIMREGICLEEYGLERES